MADPGYTDLCFGQIKDEHVPRMVAGLSAHFGYQETIDGEPNPETEVQYIRRKMRLVVASWVIQAEHKAAEDAIVIDDVNVKE